MAQGRGRARRPRGEKRAGRRASYGESLSFGGLSVVASITLAIVTSVAVSRLYGVTALGEFALAVAPSYALGFLASAQEQVALVRRVALLEPRAPEVTGLFAAVLAFSAGLATTVSLIALGVTYLVFQGPIDQPHLFAPAAIGIGGFVVFGMPVFNIDMLLSAFRAGRELFSARTLQLLVFLAVVLALSATDIDGAYALIIATVAAQAVALVHRLVLVRRFLTVRVPRSELRAGFKALPEIIRFGLKLAPRTIANGAAAQIGTWLLGAYGSVAAVGAFSRAFQLATRFLEVSTRVAEVLVPTLAERSHAGDREGFDRAVVDSLRLSTFAGLAPAAVLGGAAVGVMAVFGSGFPAAASALVVLLLGPVFAALSNVQAQVLIVLDRPLQTSVITIARSLLTLAVSIPLVIHLGALGAGLGWVLGYLGEVLVLQVLTIRELETPMSKLWPWHRQLAQLAAYGAGFGASRLVDSLISSIWGIVPAGIAGGVAYVLAFIVFGGMAPRDWERLRRGRAVLVSKVGARRAARA